MDSAYNIGQFLRAICGYFGRASVTNLGKVGDLVKGSVTTSTGVAVSPSLGRLPTASNAKP